MKADNLIEKGSAMVVGSGAWIGGLCLHERSNAAMHAVRMAHPMDAKNAIF